MEDWPIFVLIESDELADRWVGLFKVCKGSTFKAVDGAWVAWDSLPTALIPYCLRISKNEADKLLKSGLLKKTYTVGDIQKMEDEVNARNGWKPIRTKKGQGFIIITKLPKEIEKKEKEGEY